MSRENAVWLALRTFLARQGPNDGEALRPLGGLGPVPVFGVYAAVECTEVVITKPPRASDLR